MTRKDGWRNVIFCVVPSLYIIFYITAQAKAGDYKEMFAAIVALFFALLHLLRSLWGLWQLELFREWACQSICSLQALGIDYQDSGLEDPPESIVQIEKIVDQLLVNDSVADNQLFHGEVRCFLVYNNKSFLSHPIAKLEGYLPYELRLVFSITKFLFTWAVDRVVALVSSSQTPSLQLVPYHPMDVWLNWSVVFASQGLHTWIRDFETPEDPDSEALRRMPSNNLYERRQSFFAGEILATAALHSWPSSIHQEVVPSPVLWHTWLDESDICAGKMTKADLLNHAMSNGKILPFGYPQHDGSAEDHILSEGYEAYRRKLERIVESVPASFGPEIESFDVHMLEWFTILLDIGFKVAAEAEQQRLFSRDHDHDAVNTISTEGQSAADLGNGIRSDLEFSFKLLESQLGRFSRDDLMEPLNTENARTLIAFPLPTQSIVRISAFNPLGLEAGELVDIWLALVAGEQFSEGIEKTILLRQEDPFSPPTTTDSYYRSSKPPDDTESGSETERAQFKVEMQRLMQQYWHKNQRYWHQEQTISFVGYGMECVRSSLGAWVNSEQTDTSADDAWKPRLDFCTVDELLIGEYLDVGNVTRELSIELYRAGTTRYLSRRVVQVRLIWELQNAVRLKSQEVGGGPSSIELIILCLLCFPALSISVPEPNNASSILPCRLLVRPCYGPQEFYVCVELFRASDEIVSMQVCLAREVNCASANFHWEQWRDAFQARLLAKEHWQSQHDIASISTQRTTETMCADVMEIERHYMGDKKKFCLWPGWRPFRNSLSLFEIRNVPLGIEISYTNDVTAVLRKSSITQTCANVLNAGEAEVRDNLQRNHLSQLSLFISELFIERDSAQQATMHQSHALSRELFARKVIGHSSYLLARSPNSHERVLTLLEASAAGFRDAEGIVACVQVLTNGKHMSKNVQRAVRVIDEHLVLFGRSKETMGTRTLSSILKAYVRLYEEFMMESGYDRAAVHLFCRFLGWMMWIGPAANFDHAVVCLRKIFIRTRQFDAVHMLGVGNEIEVARSPELAGFLGHARQLYFERAIDHDSHVGAMKSLTHLLGTATESVPRDLERAKNLENAACEVSQLERRAHF